jgi:homoserine kinase type II
LQPRLSGSTSRSPNNQHCAQVGELLAHPPGHGERIIERRTDRGLDWMLEGPVSAAPERSSVLCCRRWTNHRAQGADLALPRANLHADLFRDNVMFEGTHLTG